jgi:hypothetical protein
MANEWHARMLKDGRFAGVIYKNPADDFAACATAWSCAA